MRSFTVLAATLACLLSLSACMGTTKEGGCIPESRENVYSSTSIPEIAYSDDSSLSGVDSENSITDISAPELNIATLKDIAERTGGNLTWTDFSSYYCEDIGSGIYILR